MRQVETLGRVRMLHTRHGDARRRGRRKAGPVGIVTRDLITGEVTSPLRLMTVVLATGGYSNAFYLSTNAMAIQRHRSMEGASKRGAAFANPCFTQIHPTCIPASERGVPVEADADVGITPKRRAHAGCPRNA